MAAGGRHSARILGRGLLVTPQASLRLRLSMYRARASQQVFYSCLTGKSPSVRHAQARSANGRALRLDSTSRLVRNPQSGSLALPGRPQSHSVTGDDEKLGRVGVTEIAVVRSLPSISVPQQASCNLHLATASTRWAPNLMLLSLVQFLAVCVLTFSPSISPTVLTGADQCRTHVSLCTHYATAHG